VYWAGAAIALLVDLEIRRLGRGLSLDDAMRRFSRRPAADGGAWAGLDLLRAVDAWLGRAVAVPVAERWLASAEFPDVSSAYAALGIRAEDGDVVLVPGAARERDRGAIMRSR
jgi:predicted metalloprotease with PDZ domain